MPNLSRYNKIDYTGLLGSFIASWILHCALFAIAATTTIFYPPTANREYISVDLLFASPGSGTPDQPEKVPAQISSLQSAELETADTIEADEPIPVKTPQTEVSSDLELLPLPAPTPAKKTITPMKTTPPPVSRPRVQKTSAPPPPAPVIVPAPAKAPEADLEEAIKPATAEVEPPPALEIQAKSLEQSAEEKLAIENEKIRRQQQAEEKAAQERAEEEAAEVARAKELSRQEAVNAARAEKERIHRQLLAEQRAAKERTQEKARAAELEKREAEKAHKARLAVAKAQAKLEAAEKARQEQLVLLKKAEEKTAREKQAHELAVAEKAVKDRLEQARLAAITQKNINMQPAKPAGNQLLNGAAKAAGAVIAAAPPEKALINVAQQTGTSKPKNQPEQKGFALPPVNGDIKLIMTSEEDLVVKVLFVSYPKVRHDKPLSKKEAKEQQKLTPIIVRTAKDTLEAVIERSREGIYIFLVEQKGSKPVTGAFSLKLFETKNKAVTGREISGQTEVARLLMPEGILWEDDSAFSGNIEDSDSVTKFNSDSGLVWKEYRR